ncbi:oxygenase MpaB family protein [Marmoricola sp. RAF53]|uniref:oxygenase MpaB family protein n=1 Tax=Marmoricola sp. RAF53 TaxID=3233059 RepID=UPI003F9A954A
MFQRYANRDRIERLDPVTDAAQIYRISAHREFPWDIAQALGLALLRTYAVPSVGNLLHRTGQFTEHTQKRYDDTVMLVDAVTDYGLDDARGRTAVRRINQMHRSYDISNGDLLYVLCTFVVVPVRWIDTWGWRPTTHAEREAAARVYANLGRHMGITGIPEHYAGFAELQDAYEAEHFAFDPGAHAVATATLDLMTTFRPFAVLPPAVTRRLSYAMLDEPLLRALGLPLPTDAERRLVAALFRGRARVERLMPPRRRDKPARDLSSVRTYPKGARGSWPLEELGTFPGCPVQHDAPAAG